jgi:hypothetical protein
MFRSLLAVNTGQFVVLPTPASLAFMERWNSLARPGIQNGTADQPALKALQQHAFETCPTLCACFRAHRNVSGLDSTASLAAAAVMLGHCPVQSTREIYQQVNKGKDGVVNLPCSSQNAASGSKCPSFGRTTHPTSPTPRCPCVPDRASNPAVPTLSC